MHFFGQFKDHNSDRRPHKWPTFSTRTVFVFEKSQNSFYCSPSPFVPFWSALYLNLVQKLPIWIAHHTFLKSRHPEVTKKPYYVFPPREAKKGISSWIISVRVRHSQLGFCTGLWRVYGLPPCGSSCLWSISLGWSVKRWIWLRGGCCLRTSP